MAAVNKMKLSKRHLDFIKSQGVARLATVNGDGIPHNVPVCALFERGKVYVGSEKEARKVKNIKENPWAAIVFDEYRDSWTVLRGVMFQCQTRIVDEKEFKKIRRKLYSKYPKYESEAPMEPDDSVIIELVPEKKFSWGFE
jgi:nitroimidazol reductase NimA-like FMN-containing flavoprotein (pyridoxamine 5'-phosphate oxidase superfamily)